MLSAVVRIFVSSTWLDLQPERRAVEKAIHRLTEGKFEGMEYFGSRPENTEQASLAEVDQANLYIGVIGGRYGSGITEQEYRRARERGLPCIIYFKSDRAVPPEGRDNEAEKAARLAAFKQQLMQAHIIREPFNSPEELALCVTQDFYRWYNERHAAQRARDALGNVVTTRDDGRVVRAQVGAAEGILVYHSAPAQLRPRPAPVQPSLRRFGGLLDRTEESAAAAKSLQELAPVELYGQSGIGKTALLRHLAYQPRNGHFPDGVIYCNQVNQQPANDLLQFIFDALYESAADYKPRPGELRQLLQHKQALVLLDDVELPRKEIEYVLDGAKNCAFLFAARERRLVGEGRALLLPGLPAAEATQLLEQKLERPLAPEERAAAQSICALLAGHPLHIAQAAAIALERKLPLGALASRMQAAHAQGLAPATLLNQQMAAAGSDDEKRALAALAALEGAPVRAESLAAITGADNIEATLGRLAQRKLVEPHAAGYRLTSGLQAILQRDWDLTEWRTRARAHFTKWAEQNKHDRQQLGAASAALLTVFNWAAQNERWDETKRLGKALEGELILSGRWEAWGQVLQQINQAATATGDEETAAWVLHQQGTRALCLGNDETARRLLTEALERRAEMGDHIAAAATQHNLDWLFPPVLFRPEPTTPAADDRFKQGGRGRRTMPGWLKFFGAALLVGLGALLIPLFTGPSAQAEFAPRQLSFTNQTVGQEEVREVTLTNLSSAVLTIADAAITGADQNYFAIGANDCRGRSLARNETCRLSVVFNPSQPGEREATLILRGATGAELPSLPLRGVVITATSTATPAPVATATPMVAVTPTASPTSNPSVTPTAPPTPLPAAVVRAFYLEPESITAGETARLCYEVQQARDAALNPSVEPVRLGELRCVPVAPAKTTDYTLTATGQDGRQVQRTARLMVTLPPPAIQFLTANPTVVRAGEGAELCYGVRNAAQVSLAPNGGNLPVSAKYCLPVAPKSTTVYELTATSADGRSDRRQVTIEVKPRARAPEIRHFYAQPESSKSGAKIQLCYSIANATRAQIDQGIGAIERPEQDCVTDKPKQTTTYTLTAYGSDGQVATRQATVTIEASKKKSDPIEPDKKNPKDPKQERPDRKPDDSRNKLPEELTKLGEQLLTPPTIIRFSANPPAIKAGEQAQLCYQIANARAAQITPAPGALQQVESGCVTVRPQQTTTYTLTAKGAVRSARSATTIKVEPPPNKNPNSPPIIR